MNARIVVNFYDGFCEFSNPAKQKVFQFDETEMLIADLEREARNLSITIGIKNRSPEAIRWVSDFIEKQKTLMNQRG